MSEIEKEMIGHLKTFPERRKELLAFQKNVLDSHEEIKKQIQEGLMHPQPSARTIAMVGEVKDMVAAHIKEEEAWKNMMAENQERLNRVVFGDQDNMGMNAQIKEMYKKLIEVDGVKGFFKWILLTSSVVSAIYLLVKKL